ncbi:MAG TPA: TonB C-terminal domain-containing protein [Syntrophorhabdaceae bacterium]|nr:TonB C-terminal domain-containing protein [Syntrophorhabdaceae bacterium]
MAAKKKTSTQSAFVITGAVILVLALLAGGLIYLVASDKGGSKKQHIATVDLVKPLPPPKEPPPPKEKPPEPEAQKKAIEAVPQMAPQSEARAMKGDGKPVADGPLGLEGDGGAGSDGFGLAAKGKGGRDVITLGKGGGAGGFDQGGLLRKYAWYTRLVEKQLNGLVRKRLDENKGWPKSKWEALVYIQIDEGGTISGFKITRPSGFQSVDDAVKECLRTARIGEPLPEGIHTAMNVKISS